MKRILRCAILIASLWADPSRASTTAPSTQPLISFSTATIPIEFPALSGRLFDQFGYSFHGQATITPFYHGDFPAAYESPRGFSSRKESATAYTGTLFTGIRILPGTDIYFDPEVTAGSGLSGVTGLGDPPNSESKSVVTPDPTPNVARIFLRETLGLGGEQEDITDGPNQIIGKQDINRLTITVGKYAVNDILDNNSYSHDGRSQFFNWNLSDVGSWDFAADIQGYTDALTLDLNTKNWALRYSIARPPAIANRGQLDTHYDRAFDQAIEFEQRYTLLGQLGIVRPMFFFDYAHMGDYRDAINASPINPDVTRFRSYAHPKYGFSLNAEQAITADVGIFGRAGWNNGQSESWSYAEVDRSLSLGVSLKGSKWNRPNDVVGAAGIMSGLAKDHRDYLAAGGVGGFGLGDARLHYAPEEVIEMYYLLAVTKNLFLSADYQFLNHPGYNADRGPASIGGFRVHFEF